MLLHVFRGFTCLLFFLFLRCKCHFEVVLHLVAFNDTKLGSLTQESGISSLLFNGCSLRSILSISFQRILIQRLEWLPRQWIILKASTVALLLLFALDSGHFAILTLNDFADLKVELVQLLNIVQVILIILCSIIVFNTSL